MNIYSRRQKQHFPKMFLMRFRLSLTFYQQRAFYAERSILIITCTFEDIRIGYFQIADIKFLYFIYIIKQFVYNKLLFKSLYQNISFFWEEEINMIKTISKYITKDLLRRSTIVQNVQYLGNIYKTKQYIKLSVSNYVSLNPKYFFSRKVIPLQKTGPTIQEAPKTEGQTRHQLKPNNATIPQPKIQSQFYTLTELQKDLQTYQQFLNIFNTHTKKAHDKLLRNQVRIIQSIIDAKRQDLLVKFLSTNPRNRLANPQTLPLISKYFKQKLNSDFSSIISASKQCQFLLQVTTLLTQYNQMELYKQFSLAINNQFDLDAGTKSIQQCLLQIIVKLPSRQCQFLFVYNFLIKQKQLPSYFMQSEYFGIHTQNLRFNNLGQAFYDIRKFVRRYFAIYKKGVQPSKQQLEQQKLKSFQRQRKKSSQGSILQKDVECFLKVLNYPLVRKQIEIDGFIVDFVVDVKNLSLTSSNRNQSLTQQQVPTKILQVMGSYHYTSTGRLKTKDIRKFILLGSKYRTKKYDISLVHFDDYNKSRGSRNKQQLIRNLVQSKKQGINWQPQHKGFDAKWQLKEMYEQFK